MSTRSRWAAIATGAAIVGTGFVVSTGLAAGEMPSVTGAALKSSAQADGAVVDCSSVNRLVAQGSSCRWEPEGEYWVLVSPGPRIPACERAEVPSKAIASSCQVLDEPGSSGEALLQFRTSAGDEIRVFVFPSGLTMPMAEP